MPPPANHIVKQSGHVDRTATLIAEPCRDLRGQDAVNAHLVGHFLGFVTGIDAGCVDGDAERIEFRFGFLVAD